MSSHAKLIIMMTSAFLLLGLSSCSTGQLNGPHSDTNLTNSTPSNPRFSVSLSSNELVGGSILVVTVTTDDHLDQDGTMAVLGSVASPFYKVGDATSNRFQAVLAVPYSEEPGEMALQILPKGDLSSAKEFPVKITEVDRPVERIRVSRKFTSRRRRSIAMLNDPSLTREQVYQRVTLHKYWDGSFHFPIDSKITSPFGTQRTFNRKMHSFHAGVDFHAPIGTPVSPSAPGVVVISRKMFATGNTIVIDHGYGIFTIYAHLSRLKVKVGSLVNTDSIIGLTGKTGRVHGAHLHWGAVVRGVRVNSMDLVKWLG